MKVHISKTTEELSSKAKIVVKQKQISAPVVVGPEPLADDIARLPTPNSMLDFDGDGINDNPASSELVYLRRRVEYFRDILRGMLYRTPSEINDQITSHVQKIENMVYVNLIPDYIQRNYTYDFFRNEPDIDFKRDLAKAIWKAAKTRLPHYSNDMLEGLANDSVDYQYLMTSFIEE